MATFKGSMMKSVFFFACLALSLALAAPARAQEAPKAGIFFNPQMSSPAYVAMVYYKMAGKKPPFEQWAMHSESYKTATDFDKMAVRAQKAAELEKYYSLLSISDPIVIKTAVRLSPYSQVSKGFMVESFRDDTYFSFSFGGESFAVIPHRLMDYQWIDADAALGQKISNAAANKSNPLEITIYAVPLSVDRRASMALDGQDHWLVSGKVQNIVLSTADGTQVLWEKHDAGYKDKTREELMNLYR